MRLIAWAEALLLPGYISCAFAVDEGGFLGAPIDGAAFSRVDE
jgi:hypothetical protein